MIKPAVPWPVRAAQALLIVPLGLFQAAAAAFFSLTMPMAGGDYLVGIWAVVMALTDVVAGLRLATGAARWLRISFALLGAQVGFALVKLLVYHESASFVFLAFVAATLACLFLPASRLFFGAAATSR